MMASVLSITRMFCLAQNFWNSSPSSPRPGPEIAHQKHSHVHLSSEITQSSKSVLTVRIFGLSGDSWFKIGLLRIFVVLTRHNYFDERELFIVKMSIS